MPSSDARASDEIRIIDGQNFGWDSRGPKTGFSARQLSCTPLGNAIDIEGLRVGPYSLVFSSEQILQWREFIPYCWQPLYAFFDTIPFTQRSPWQGIYLNNKIYLAQLYRGFFSGAISTETGKLVLTPQYSSTILGLIPNIQGLAIVRGRAILVNNTTIQWSNTGDLTDLTPALAGPGFQAINQIAKGDYVGLSTFEDGFIVWTTEGAISAEYIGGDAVWRFDNFVSIDRPINKGCIINVIGGTSIVMTQQGIQVMDGKMLKPLTQDFNEFLRKYVEDSVETERLWRLDYDANRQQIFLSESVNLNQYNRAFVLYPTLNRWGIFSNSVCGFMPLTKNLFGYVDTNGIPNYFIDTVNRNTYPAISKGLSRAHPKVERQDNRYFDAITNKFVYVGNSSCVSNPHPIDANFAQNATVYPKAVNDYFAFADTLDYKYEGDLTGMNSFINIGYIHMPEIQGTDVGVTDIQNLIIGSYPSLIPTGLNPDLISNQKPGIYDYTVDDYNIDTVNEDWNAGGIDEDWEFSLADYMQITHTLEFDASVDGIMLEDVTSAVSQFYTGAWYYTASTMSIFNSIKISANAVGEYAHVKFLELNGTYSGQKL